MQRDAVHPVLPSAPPTHITHCNTGYAHTAAAGATPPQAFLLFGSGAVLMSTLTQTNTATTILTQ